MKWYLLFAPILLLAAPMAKEPKIAVQNSILTQVNGRTISMMDVKKQMDVHFHQNYPHLADSAQARCQFYEMSWRRFYMDMVDHELIIADALDKEIKLTDGEIRESLEQRFGPHIMQTLDKLHLTYDEAWKMVKDDMIVQRMSWWFIHSRALGNVTPDHIRQAYRSYLNEHPAHTEWTYRVITLRTEDLSQAEAFHTWLLKEKPSPDALLDLLKTQETPDVSVSLSNELSGKSGELSDSHREALHPLQVGAYSPLLSQVSRSDKKPLFRIFYLIQRQEIEAPSFDAIAPQLKHELLQKATMAQSDSYIGKLRKHHGFDAKTALPEDLHPFSMQ